MSLIFTTRRAVSAMMLAAVYATTQFGPAIETDRLPVRAASASIAAPVAANGAVGLREWGTRKFIPRMPRHQLFGPASEWRRDVTDAPVSASSSGLVANLHRQVTDHWNGVAAFNFDSYNVAFHQVRPGMKRSTVRFDDCQNKGYVPDQLFEPSSGGHFLEVPIPNRALTAVGTDSQLTVYDSGTDQLWEFWLAKRTEEGWQACWGGRIDDASSSPGFFEDGMGTAATGLSVSGGAISIHDIRRGRINHAMSLTLVEAAHWSELSYPAQRSDGQMPKGTPHVIREGQRLRLDPRLDIQSLHLHPIARMIAEAAQTYGFIITDKAGAVSVVTESSAGIERRTGRDPWAALMGGTPGYEIMRDFPWAQMQALPVDYGRPDKR